MSKRKVEALRKRQYALRDEINRIEGAERAKTLRKLVGKCYRYRNCYSCPESDADYWWLYAKLIGVHADGRPKVVEFQTDKDGMQRLEDARWMPTFPSDNWEEITREEFVRAAHEFAARMRETFDAAGVRP